MLEQDVLVLNRSWVAVHITHVRRALVMVYLGLAKVVSTEDFQTYDFESWKEASVAARERCVNTTRFKLRIPEVIIIPRYGKIPNRDIVLNRRNLFERDKCVCQYCGKKLPRDMITVDHVIPRSKGGKNTWENLVLACINCNKKKSNRLPFEAGMNLIKEPVKPRAMPVLGVQLSMVSRSNWQKFLSKAYWETELKEQTK